VHKQAVTLSYNEDNTKAEPAKGKKSYQKRGKKGKKKEAAITKEETTKAKARELEQKSQGGSK
jgi:hypothetical protein